MNPADLVDLPSPEPVEIDPGRPEDATQSRPMEDQAVTLDVLRSTQVELGQARSALDRLHEDRLVDRGRAERAEARLEATVAGVAELEARLILTESALAEARLPWVVRVVRGLRGRS